MSETLRDHTLAWLDSIGADGLMAQDEHCEILKADFYAWTTINMTFVPAYRHADGTYHTFPEYCVSCDDEGSGFTEAECFGEGACASCKEWLSSKEATK